MTTYKNPSWWTGDNDSAWERTKAAFKRDWDQTKHDFGGDQPDTDQDVNDTVKQAAGSQPIPPRGEPNYEEIEPAYRYGFGARSQYRDKYPEWNEELEQNLQNEWGTLYPQRRDQWDTDVEAIRHAWENEYDESPSRR